MRTLHFLVKLAVSAAMIAAAVFVFLYPVSDLWAILTENIPDNALYRQILAVAAGIAVFLVFVPLWPKRGPKERTFSFQGTHGEVTVDLEPVEDTLERVLNKLPEVKWVTLRIEPNEEATPSEVQVFIKGSFRREDSSDVRHTSSWIQGFVKTRVQKMLGVEAVDVNLRLKNQPTNMKSVKSEPLMLAAPSPDVAPAPANQAPAVAQATAQAVAPAPVAAEARSSVPSELLEPDVPIDEESEGIRYETPAFDALEHETLHDTDEETVPTSNDRDPSSERRQPESW